MEMRTKNSMMSAGKHKEEKEEMEFGGPVGALFIMIFSHVIPYYLWICVRFYDGAVKLPSWEMVELAAAHAAPKWEAFQMYLGFLAFQAFLAVVVPGPRGHGLPVPSEGGKKLVYVCNGVLGWYITLLSALILHMTGRFSLSLVMDRFGEILTATVIVADVTSLLAYYSAHWCKKEHRMSGNFVYDFFMGAWLNPRIGTFDLKFWGETRVAWITLFLLTLSAAVKHYEVHGYITPSIAFIVTAQFLYANAVMKGEECILSTWDIFYEKWGWMLIYWNFAGVPFVYCMQSFFLYYRGPIEIGWPAATFLFVVLFGAYYIWDTSQSQRNRFRQQLQGSFVPRHWLLAFPQLPWGTVKNPEYLETKSGSKLLIGGWWKYARKIHYATDIAMALEWGLCCGFGSFIPYFYPVFFFCMIMHRYNRDRQRCIQKYGDDWTRYEKIVPYAFIPGII